MHEALVKPHCPAMEEGERYHEVTRGSAHHFVGFGEPMLLLPIRRTSSGEMKWLVARTFQKFLLVVIKHGHLLVTLVTDLQQESLVYQQGPLLPARTK